MFERGFEVFNGFIHSMHENILAWHAARDGNRDLAFACAIDEQTVCLSPYGESLTQEGFAGIGDMRRSWIKFLQGSLVLCHRRVQRSAIVKIQRRAVAICKGSEVLSCDEKRTVLDLCGIGEKSESVEDLGAGRNGGLHRDRVMGFG